MDEKDHRGAIRFGDQWRCQVCQKVWDANDPDVPPCAPVERPKIDSNTTGQHKRRNRKFRGYDPGTYR